mgnify:CR=1 FL=1
MKRFLSKTWAKLTAFFLTLVFSVMTALGAVGIGVLASSNVFLDGGAALRKSLYEEYCMRAIYSANDFLHDTLANTGLLAGDGTPDDSGTDNWDPIEEEQRQVLEDLDLAFARKFPRESSACHLAVVNKDTGEITFENFALTDSDKPLYSTQESFTYTVSDGHKVEFNFAADLLRFEDAQTYFDLLLTWLLNHTGLTVFLTLLFLLLTLLCFLFSMASAGHWPGREGIHLTWLDRIPADVFLGVLVLVSLMGWYESYYDVEARVMLAALLLPFPLLFLCVFAAQCKAGTVLRGSLIARVLRLLWRIIKAVTRWLYRIAASLPLIWKTAVVTLALFFIEMILMLIGHGFIDGIFLTIKLLEFLTILYIALNLRTLQKGGEKLAEGDYSQSIDTKLLFGDFKRYGQRMNALRTGMERAVQEQTRAERMKTELITNVSHDIKTPLTSIVNYVDLLQKEDVQPEIAREYIAVLDRQSHRLKKLTEDLVEASKASSGALPVELQSTDVTVLFDQIVGEYQERLAGCRLTLVTRPPENPLFVRADGKLLSRVMDNLVSNICKYALEDTRVYVVAASDEKTVTISFKNVSRAELNVTPDELMERFVRGDASRHTEGSGLGLSIAGSLVHLMGGTFALSIDGDLFRADITLPRA